MSVDAVHGPAAGVAREGEADERPLTIIRPPGGWPGLGLRDLWRFRSICLVLVKRNLKVRYRQTLIGAAWAIIQPVMLMIVFTIFFGIIARMPRQGDVPFPVFYLAGLVIWHAASKMLSGGTVSVIQNKGLIEKVYFPRVYFPISAALVGLVDMAFGMIPLFILLGVFGISPSVGIVLIPVLIVIGIAAVIGVALWLAALNAAYRDVTHMLPFIIQIWFFASPILYPAAFVPEEFQALYYLNPMALAVTGFRWGFAGLPPPPPEAWLISPAVAAFLLISGYLFFRHREPTFDDVL